MNVQGSTIRLQIVLSITRESLIAFGFVEGFARLSPITVDFQAGTLHVRS